MNAAQIADMTVMTEVEASAIAYVEAAGDVEAALRWAIEDLVKAERALAEARLAMSAGYARLAPQPRG